MLLPPWLKVYKRPKQPVPAGRVTLTASGEGDGEGFLFSATTRSVTPSASSTAHARAYTSFDVTTAFVSTVEPGGTTSASAHIPYMSGHTVTESAPPAARAEAG